MASTPAASASGVTGAVSSVTSGLEAATAPIAGGALTPVVQTVGGLANTVTATVAPTAGTTVLAPVAGLVTTTTGKVNQVLIPVPASPHGQDGGAVAQRTEARRFERRCCRT